MTGDAGARPPVVVMGVSASGKSTVGRALAEHLRVEFVDADDLHPRANVEKMSAGTPLEDADRWPWLDATAGPLSSATTGIVVACSALKRSYRDRIRSLAPQTVFVHLEGDPELLMARSRERVGHFMPSSLLASQCATLERLDATETGFGLDFSRPVAELVEEAAGRIR
jgi:carbohydrate kinase (thermoresistant glucokinase family)